MTKNTAIIIPARYASTRYPGKPLEKICSIPMIIHVAARCSEAVGRDNVYIATDSDDIVNVARKHGYEWVKTSDKCLTGSDRVAEAIPIIIDSYKEKNYTYIVNVQGDEPLISFQDIIEFIENSPIGCFSYGYQEYSGENDNTVIKCAIAETGELVYASRADIPASKGWVHCQKYKQVCVCGAPVAAWLEYYGVEKEKSELESIEDVEILRVIGREVVQMIRMDSFSMSVDLPEHIKTVQEIMINDPNYVMYAERELKCQ